MEEYISADPVKFDHSQFFKVVQTLTLDFRLNDPFCSLVSCLSILHRFIIDAHYCVLTNKLIYFGTVHRVGSHLVKFLFWMNIVPATASEAVTATYGILLTCCTGLNVE